MNLRKMMIVIIFMIGMSSNYIQSYPDNKTALYQAQNYDTYLDLRHSGADFEIIPFMYFHPKFTAVTTITLLVIVSRLHAVGYFSYDRFEKYIQKIQSKAIQTVDDLKEFIYADDCVHDKEKLADIYDIHDMKSKDTLGRTPLINYLIEQEKILVQLRLDLKQLENYKAYNQEAKFRYFDAVFEYKLLCTETKDHIKKMIDLGAVLDVQDCYGKSLFDYCQTQENYHALRESGAFFEIKQWIYFDSQEFGALLFIASGCAAVAATYVYVLSCSSNTHYRR